MNFMDLLFYDRVTTVELYVFTIQVTDENVRKSMISSNAECLQKESVQVAFLRAELIL